MKIVEMFQSVQGEGLRTGVPSFFIRTWGCNLRCTWCDTKYSYEGDEYKEYPVEQIVRAYENDGCGDIVITGGEPFVQVKELEELVYRLPAGAFDRKIYIETNATVFSEVVAQAAHMVLSPKLAFRDVEDDVDVIKKYCLCALSSRDPVQIKIVVDNLDTYAKAKELRRQLHEVDADIVAEWILTPNGAVWEAYCTDEAKLWEYRDDLQDLIKLVLEDCNKGLWKANKIRVLPQVHKLIWGDKKGV